MKHGIWMWALVGWLGAFSVPGRAADFAFGADLSFLKQAEDGGKVFRDGTNAVPGLQLFHNPWWHGSLTDLRENLAFASRTYGKDVIVVETAYYWRPNRETADRPEPFPETPAGQRQFLEELTRTVMDTPEGRGKGVFWWEPAVTGGLGGRGFFDDQGQALPVLSAFDAWTRPAKRE